VFGYDFAGSVHYKTKGVAGGCTYLGGGTRAFGPGEFIAPDTITFAYLHGRYGGAAGVDTFFYSIAINCGGPFPGTLPGPIASRNFFYSPVKPLPFGATQISGTVTTKAGAWTWDLN